MNHRQAVIEIGDKIHVITRRHFKEDVRRHFAGEVIAVSDWAFRASGYSFLFDPYRAEYKRLPERRTRVIGISDSGHITVVLPTEILIDRLTYHTHSGRIVITDGKDFNLEVNEIGGIA